MAVPGFRGHRLAEARQAARLTEDQLAQAVGMSSARRVRDWERGAERPRPRLIPQLAGILGIDPLELLDVDAEDPPLAALRVVAGLSIEEVGGAPGLSVMAYHRLESGAGMSEPEAKTASAVASVLGIGVSRVEAAIRRSRADRS